MQTIEKIFQAEYEAKKSTFLAFLAPFGQFEKKREFLKKTHPKAAHIVWAYRVLNEFDQVVENQSDDGEPKGTSGPPCLNVLRGSELVNCGVLVVRYFGGIKLGTGGLVRAYSGACNGVISQSELIKYEKLFEVNFFIPYALMPRFEHYFDDNFEIKKEFLADGVRSSTKMTEKQKDSFLEFAIKYEYQGLKFNP